MQEKAGLENCSDFPQVPGKAATGLEYEPRSACFKARGLTTAAWLILLGT
jgi:hypothetical protein